ncbi:c-type cytochrome [Tautonia sociabilis]|uniref:C-type cytochrome n=1 Tax=Tautonia sociabilis TaxID=2080755 RepID=A0A432MJF7_9BACT|nr:c-type cytochrome [Tautonia sociabilis]RUL87533.1 c-type cytochrome [Tautonia sociabilis]
MDDDLDAMEGAGPSGSNGMFTTIAVAAVLILAALTAGLVANRRPAGDPGALAGGDAEALVAEGKRLYDWRCVSCHGPSGRGDGPIARSLQGPGPGDLTDDEWTHGDAPDQVLAVITKGVPDTQMAGWDTAFNPDELRALAAYMYRLAGREVPEDLLDGAGG